MANNIKESLHYYTLLPMIYQVFRLVITILLARILEPKDFGILGLASIVVFYTNNITNFGFSTALINKEEITDNETNSIFTINLLISILLTVLVILFSHPIASFFKIPDLALALVAMTSIFIMTSYALVALSLLKRELKFKTISKIELSTGIVQSLLTLFLAWCGLGFWSMIIGIIVSNIMNAVLALWAARWRPRFMIRTAAIKKMLNYASWTFYEAQLRLLENYLDKLIIGKFLGPVSLGYYEKASGFAFMPVDSLVHKITGVMFSAFSRSQSEHDELLYYLEKTMVLITICCLPVFAGLAFIADYFVPLLLGEKWIPMISPLVFLLIAYAFYAMGATVGTFNVAAGSYKMQISARMLCLVLLVVLLLGFAKNGITAVAVIIMIYQLVFFNVSTFIVSRKMRINFLRIIGWIIPSIFLTALMILCLSLIRTYFCTHITVINMIILIGSGALFYVFFFFLFNFSSTCFLRNEVVLFAQKLKKRYA